MYTGELARSQSDRPLITMAGSGATLSVSEYEARANQVAHLLRSRGHGVGDHIAIFMENALDYLVIEGGTERSGGYFTCVNSFLTSEEAAYIINDSKSRAVFTSAHMGSRALELPELCPAVQLWVMSGDVAPSPFHSLEELLESMSDRPIDDETMGLPMLYSSGTTGRPKGIFRPLLGVPPSTFTPQAQFLSFMFGIREDGVYLSPAPLYHSAPQAAVSLAIRLSNHVVVMERFEPDLFLDLIERYGVTQTQMVPTMFNRLLSLDEKRRDSVDLSSLEVVVHAAAPCPIPIKEAMIDWFGPVIREYYGATEAHGFTMCESEEWRSHRGTVGKPILGELLILDEDRQPLPSHEIGEVWFRGATNFEYFNDPEKTASSKDSEGVSSTVGDMGFTDDEGYLYLTDRSSFMIISGGVNIYPQESENVLVTHPYVYDAAVLGVPNAEFGEEVKGVVQLEERIEASPEVAAELIEFCRAQLSHYKCPRSIDFVDELPRLPTGKLYKKALKDRYWSNQQNRIV